MRQISLSVSKKSLWAALIAFFLVQTALFSLEPPRSGEIDKYRADGTLESRINFAKDIGNYKVSKNLVSRFNSRINCSGQMAPPLDWQGMPTKGNDKIFALLIGFSDYEPNTAVEDVNSRLFLDGSAGDYPYESLRNFYRRSSYGLLEISGSTLGWYMAPYPRSSVSETTSGREKLIKEALNHFEAEGHDFSQYDNDGDGAIDYFVVVWTGPDTGWANFWWGYQTYFGDSSYKLDGKTLAAYSWQWEANPPSGEFSPYVVIHETGHALGLPDYYDYDDTIGPRGGVGGLDQMDGCWGDHNSFSKMLLEWLEPTVVASGTSIPVLSPTSELPEALLVMPETKPGEQFAEYYMVQYRRTTDNDSDYPNEGLLIWHLDARTDSGGYDFIYDNSYSDHKLLRLMEADGLEEIEQNKWADGGDFYTEGTGFGFQTMPSNLRYCGIQSGIEVKDISAADETISFSLSLPSEQLVITSVEKLKSPFRIKISGNGIQAGAKAVIGYDTDCWPYASFDNGSLILEKGNKLKKKFRKGSPVKILIINSDGSAGNTIYTR
jgi:M6 family metalloprotease-like protein